MKKNFTIFILCLGFKSVAQYPYDGSRTLPITLKIKLPKFCDTIEANKTGMKDYEGSLIQIDTLIYFRAKNKWVQIIPSTLNKRVTKEEWEKGRVLLPGSLPFGIIPDNKQWYLLGSPKRLVLTKDGIVPMKKDTITGYLSFDTTHQK